MAITHYDQLIFQTPRPGLSSVRWKKVKLVAGVPTDITAWAQTDVVEIASGNYYIKVPIEDTDPNPTLIVCDTGDVGPIVRVVKAIEFSPNALVPTPISPFLVDDDHKWKLREADELIASNIITETAGFIGLVAFDLSVPIPNDTTIKTINLASFSPALTLGTALIATNKLEIHVPVTTLSTDVGTFTFTTSITTEDNQTFIRSAYLILQAAP